MKKNIQFVILMVGFGMLVAKAQSVTKESPEQEYSFGEILVATLEGKQFTGNESHFNVDKELAKIFNRPLLPNGHFDFFTQDIKATTPSLPKKSLGSSAAVLYPNPALGGMTTVKFNLSTSAIVNIKILNILGKQELAFSHQIAEGINKVDLDLNGLAKGIYFVSFEANSKQLGTVEKLIVN